MDAAFTVVFALFVVAMIGLAFTARPLGRPPGPRRPHGDGGRRR